MEEREKLTGEELRQAFQEGFEYLEGLQRIRPLDIVLGSGESVKVSVWHLPEPDARGLQVFIEFPSGREMYRIDPFEGLNEVHVPAPDVTHTQFLGDVSPFLCGWVELKTFRSALEPGYQEFIEGQKQLALKVIDTIRAGIRQ